MLLLNHRLIRLQEFLCSCGSKSGDLDLHRLAALVLDRDRDLVRGPAAEGLGVGAVEEAARHLRRAVGIGVGHPEGRGHERFELSLEAGQAGDRERAVGGAVIGDRAADHLVLHRLAGELEVVLGELPGRLDRLAAAGGEEDAVEVAGGEGGQGLGQLDSRGVRVGPQRVEGHLAGLGSAGLGEIGAAVAELVDEEPGQTVEVALAGGVPDVGALTAHDDGDVSVLVGPVAREMHPQVVLRGGLLVLMVVRHTAMVRAEPGRSPVRNKGFRCKHVNPLRNPWLPHGRPPVF